MFRYRVLGLEYLVQSRSFELCFCQRYWRDYDQNYVRTCFPSLFELAQNPKYFSVYTLILD